MVIEGQLCGTFVDVSPVVSCWALGRVVANLCAFVVDVSHVLN